MSATRPPAQVDRIEFTKLEGLGNDFVLIDGFFAGRGEALSVTPELARCLLDRRLGVGGDQLLWLRPPLDPSKADSRMEIFNPDGSIAEMCGNGIRAFALYFHQRLEGAQGRYRIETLAGIKSVEMVSPTVVTAPFWPDASSLFAEKSSHTGVYAPVFPQKASRLGPKFARYNRRVSGGMDIPSIRVDMGPPTLGPTATSGEEIAVMGERVTFHEIGMGNPHAVFFGEDLDRPISKLHELGPEALGPAIERHSRFPSRTNVEFVQILAPDLIQVRVWERGAGLTLACGTGACASAVAAIVSGRIPSGPGPVRVRLPGGELRISWSFQSDKAPLSPVFMEGPAREVFRGEYFTD